MITPNIHASYTSPNNNFRRNLPWFVKNKTTTGKNYTIKTRDMSADELDSLKQRIFEYKRTRNVILTLTFILASGLFASLVNLVV